MSLVQMIVTLALDTLLAGLLLATIFFCSKLNTRIKVLQDSKSELAQLIQRFNDSTDRASQSVMELQSISKKVVENIQTKIDKANFLADDLNFMIEKGNKVADNMEAGLTNRKGGSEPRRQAEAPAAAVVKQAAPAKEANINPAASRSGAGIEKLAAAGKDAAAAAKAKASTLESVLEKLSGKGEPGKPTARIRSKAEQELLDALKRG